jgi:hypothetical protein
MADQDLVIRCDANRAELYVHDIDRSKAQDRDVTTAHYPISLATFDAIWNSALEHVTPSGCLTRGEAIPGTKRLEGYNNGADASHHGFSLGYGGVANGQPGHRSAGCVASPAWDPTVATMQWELDRARERNPGPLPTCSREDHIACVDSTFTW